MFKFLQKDEKEYKMILGSLLIGNKKITTTTLKTFLWLPNNDAKTPHLYIYIDEQSLWEGLKSKLDTSRKINFEASICSLNGHEHEKILIKDIHIEYLSAGTVTGNWFKSVIKIDFFKHLIEYLTDYTTFNEKELKFFITNSRFLRSDYIVEEDYNGERVLKNKKDIVIPNLEHLKLEKIVVDTSLKQNIIEIISLEPCNSYLQYFKSKLPIIDYVLAITSFAERRFVYSFQMCGCINNRWDCYYQGDKIYHSSIENFRELISISDFKEFLENSLKLKLNHIKNILPFFARFNYINRTRNTLENKITGMVFLLERYIRYKGKNPNHKITFIRESNVESDDIIDIKTIKNVRNCIAHGHDDLPSDDLALVNENLEILMERILLNELKWDFTRSAVSKEYLKLNYRYYLNKDLKAIKRINKCT